jgi:hypothetical protein
MLGSSFPLLTQSRHQQIEIPQCSGCCRTKMAYQPRTVGDKVMILPTWSGYTDDNTQNLWKRGSDLRKRSPHTGVVCSRTALEKYQEEPYRYSHDRHADCRADLLPVRKCGTRVAVELLGRR